MPNGITFTKNYIEIDSYRDDIPYLNKVRGGKYRTTSRNVALFENPPKELYDAEMQKRDETAFLLANGPQIPNDWLREPQRLGRELALIHDRYGFFYDTRTGKTILSLQIIDDDLKKNPDHKWLVLCPLILIEDAWLSDSRKYFPHLEVVNLHASTKKKRLKQYKKEGNIYISNTESFIYYKEHIEKLPIHGCVVDESSSMKSHSSKFGKAAVKYAQKVKRWYLLSGTPAPNGEWEYYRQLQSIDRYGVHKYWTHFKNYFFYNVSYNPQYEDLIIKGDKKDELYALLKRYTIRVDKEDVLNTPGKEFRPVEFEMPKELKQHYDHMRKKLYLDFDDNLITASTAATKLNKLNQITSGFVIDTMKEETKLLSLYRFDKLDEVLASIDGQAVIWCNYRKEFEILKDRIDCVCVYGATKDKVENIKRFKRGDVKYLVANPASASKGLTLTNAHHAVYFSLNYSYELWYQSGDRIYGDITSQPDKCIYHILMAKGTIDKSIYRAIHKKEKISQAVLEHLKGGVHVANKDN